MIFLLPDDDAVGAERDQLTDRMCDTHVQSRRRVAD